MKKSIFITTLILSVVSGSVFTINLFADGISKETPPTRFETTSNGDTKIIHEKSNGTSSSVTTINGQTGKAD